MRQWIFAEPPHGGTKTEGADHESSGAHKRRIISAAARSFCPSGRAIFPVCATAISHLHPQGKIPTATYAAQVERSLGPMATKTSNSHLTTASRVVFLQKSQL
jgi:hypothetical protein